MCLAVLDPLLIWAFLICRELAVLSCLCHSFRVTKDKISDPDGMELDDAIMEPCDVELVECLLKEGVTSDRGEEVKSFSECCIVQFFLQSC